MKILSKISSCCERCHEAMAKYIVQISINEHVSYTECWCRSCTWGEQEWVGIHFLNVLTALIILASILSIQWPVFLQVINNCAYGLVKKNENQQNLLNSRRIGSTIEEKAQSIRDSYQSIEEISGPNIWAQSKWFNNDHDFEGITNEIWT